MLVQPSEELFGSWSLKDIDDVFAWLDRMPMFGHVGLFGAYWRFMVQNTALGQ
jgi:hypothetical protein